MAVLVTLVTVAACLVVVFTVALSSEGEAPRAEGAPAPSESARPVLQRTGEPAAIRIYRTWQRRRERAWAAGDLDALRRLYVAPDVARADVRLLRAWLERGAAGVDLSHQLLSYDVLRAGERRVGLRVTQRLARSVVRSDGPARSLPRGAAHVQEVVLRRSDEQWVVATVREVPDAATAPG